MLAVPPSASEEELKRAWRRLALQLHPDKGGCEAAFLAVRKAFATLSDPAKREEYDFSLHKSREEMLALLLSANGLGHHSSDWQTL